MAQFFKFKFIITFELIFYGVNFINKITNFDYIKKLKKIQNKIMKLAATNFEHLYCKIWS